MDYDQELDLIAAVDACRPGSDDALLPETAAILGRAPPARVAELRRSIEKIDRAISAAARQAPVPDGLADRILASLPSAAAHGPSPALAVAGEEESRAASWRPSRRLLTAAGAAMAASLLLAIVLWPARKTLNLVEAQTQARAFYEADDHGAELSHDTLPATLPVASNLVVGARSVALFGRIGQAYELATRGGRQGRHAQGGHAQGGHAQGGHAQGGGGLRGTLYVIPWPSFRGPALAGLPAEPEPHGTLGSTVAVWSSGGDVYVMVVQGDERAFWAFFARGFA